MTSCILLAAGSSTRFGSNKLQHVMPNGKTVFENSLSIYLSLVPELLVVIRPDDSVLKQCLKSEAVSYIECAESIDGMSRSLVAGVRARSKASGWIVALADMPYVMPQTVTQILHLSDQQNIVQPTYQSTPGNPVYFGKEFYTELTQLSGDKGGKEVLRRQQENVIRFDSADAGVLHDIDLPTDIMN